ncbi:MAG: hypothetical protein RL141_613 [Candidatus Parcubacteria bacterium]|jgi:cell wall-associated NlpC family hydrolase
MSPRIQLTPLITPLLVVAVFFIAHPAHAATTNCLCQDPNGGPQTCLQIDAQTLTGGQRMNGACARFPSVASSTYATWTCAPNPASNEACEAAEKAREPVAPTVEETIFPELNVPIPGLTFTQPDATGGNSFLAQYVAAIYRYAFSITAIVTTVMFVYGAFMYLLGSTFHSLTSGKEIMKDAVLGMLLVFGAAFIVRTVNPGIVELRTVAMLRIETTPFTLVTTGGDSNYALARNIEQYTPPNVLCPKTGGPEALQRIVASMQGKVTYRFGGKGGPPPYLENQSPLAGTMQFNNYCPEGTLCLDCSGFIHYVLRCAGLSSPRGGGTASIFQGAETVTTFDASGASVNNIPLNAGDLVGWRKSGAGHIFLYLGGGLVADAKAGMAGRQPGANPRVQKLSDALMKNFTHVVRLTR